MKLISNQFPFKEHNQALFFMQRSPVVTAVRFLLSGCLCVALMENSRKIQVHSRSQLNHTLVYGVTGVHICHKKLKKLICPCFLSLLTSFGLFNHYFTPSLWIYWRNMPHLDWLLVIKPGEVNLDHSNSLWDVWGSFMLTYVVAPNPHRHSFRSPCLYLLLVCFYFNNSQSDACKIELV